MAHELDFAALSLDDAVPADLGAFEAVQAREEAAARNRALELKAQACDNAAEACWRRSTYGEPTTKSGGSPRSEGMFPPCSSRCAS